MKRKMNPVIRNILAIVAGVVLGSAVNMGIIMIGGSIIPPPEGADVSTMEGLKASLHLFQPKHFIMPFLAHAIGTLAGAIIVGVIAKKNKMRFALGIGLFFLIMGTINVFMLPAPMWFNILDIVGAYSPMAWLGGKLVERIGQNKKK